MTLFGDLSEDGAEKRNAPLAPLAASPLAVAAPPLASPKSNTQTRPSGSIMTLSGLMKPLGSPGQPIHRFRRPPQASMSARR